MNCWFQNRLFLWTQSFRGAHHRDEWWHQMWGVDKARAEATAASNLTTSMLGWRWLDVSKTGKG